MAANVEIQGLDAIVTKLGKLTDPTKMKRAMGQACALVERTAKQKAPKDNGALRRSITSEVHVMGANVVGVVSTPLEYAPYVEYGTGLFAEKSGRKDVPWHYQDDKGEWHTTSGQKPQPFMRPALSENREEIKRILERGMQKND